MKKYSHLEEKREEKLCVREQKNIENFLLHSQMLRDCDTV